MTADYSDWTQKMIAGLGAVPVAEAAPDAGQGEPADTEAEETASGPLSQMMLDNAPLIDAAITAYGPASVVAFFFDVAGGFATIYGLDDVPTFPGKHSKETE